MTSAIDDQGVTTTPMDPRWARRAVADAAPGPDAPLPSVSVVLPAYNEAAIIAGSLARLWHYLHALDDRYRWELVLVNDGSSDDTGPIAEAFAAAHPFVRVLHHHTNFNIGQALRYAFGTCRGDYVVTLDSDLSYAPEHVGRLLEAIRQTRAKVVVASPYTAGGQTSGVPWLRKLLSRAANRFLAATAKGELETLTGLARVYDRRFLATLDLQSTDVGINTEILYKAQILRAKVTEIPAHLDWTGVAALAPGRRSSLRVSRSLLAYISSGFLFRPLAFFALPGLGLLLLALYTLSWAAYRTIDHLVTGDGMAFSVAVSRAFQDAPHTFVVGGIALLLAVQLLSLGILAAQGKAYFEASFHQGTSLLRGQRDASLRVGRRSS